MQDYFFKLSLIFLWKHIDLIRLVVPVFSWPKCLTTNSKKHFPFYPLNHTMFHVKPDTWGLIVEIRDAQGNQGKVNTVTIAPMARMTQHWPDWPQLTSTQTLYLTDHNLEMAILNAWCHGVEHDTLYAKALDTRINGTSKYSKFFSGHDSCFLLFLCQTH